MRVKKADKELMEAVVAIVKEQAMIAQEKKQMAVKEKALASRMATLKADLGSRLPEYGGEITVGDFVARIEVVPESKSRVPTYSVVLEWAREQLARFDGELVVAMERVTDESRKVTPAYEEVVIERKAMYSQKIA